MPKSITTNQLEQQIETLSLSEQIRILEKLVKHLKDVVTPTKHMQTQPSLITRQLNRIYSEVDSSLDSHLMHAQTAILARGEWK